MMMAITVAETQLPFEQDEPSVIIFAAEINLCWAGNALEQ
jgi:hypothetical protein